MNIKNEYNRKMLLGILEDNIEKMNDKVHKRIKNVQTEKVKISRMKAVVYACKVYSDILKEQQIEDIQKQLERIEKTIVTSQNQKENEEVLLTVKRTMEELEKIKT